MKIGNYISELLFDHEMVIVPGFGAFTITNKPAQIDKDKEIISPPTKGVEFNSQITNNDGLLVGHIVTKENISRAEALSAIKDERENILYHLDKGNKVELKGVGIFSSGDSNCIQFQPFTRNENSPGFYGLTPTSLQEQEVAVSETLSEPGFETKNDFEEQDFEPVEEIDPEFKKEIQQKQKRRNWLWLLLILIPLVGAGIYIYLNQESTPPANSGDEPINQVDEPAAEIQETPMLADSLAVDSVEQIADDTVNTTINTPAQTGPDYYLIAGSFKEEENSEKYIRELQNDGYEPFRLGKKGDFFLVGLAVYKTEREALVAQDSFLMVNPESGAWVYEE